MEHSGLVKRVGGVGFAGGLLEGTPSPIGEFSQEWDAQKVDFDRDAFARFIADKGYSVCWEKAVLCPNLPRPGEALAPRDHAMGCPVCGGFGFVYVDPVCTEMLIQGIRFNENFFAYGRWDSGNSLVTAMPEYTINYFDRLTLQNGIARFNDRLVRQLTSTYDVLKYKPLCIDYVAWVNRSGQLTQFQRDVDFNTSPDGTSINWISEANQPDAGSWFTVSYTYRPRYVVLDLVHQHRDSTVKGTHYQFPVQAVAKLDYLIRNQSADPQQVVDKSPFQ